MTTLLRILRLYPLALWAGGEVFFVLVAGIAFTMLPDAHSAGLVVRSALIDLHWLGIGAGVIYLLATLGLLVTRRDTHRARAVEVALVGVMLLLTLYSQRSVIPRMESDRLSLGGDVTAISKDNPTRRDFDRLHLLSVNLEGAVLLCSLVLIALAPVQDRRAHERLSS
jgi:Domain of unknown function (DUF4149)